jgi:hypothetical protein
MIDHQKGVRVVVCDRCGEQKVLPLDTDFEAVIAEIKAEGWLIRKVISEWNHYCEGCKAVVSGKPKQASLFGRYR